MSYHFRGKSITVDHRALAEKLLVSPKYWGGSRMDRKCTWLDPDILKLQILCEASTPVEASADSIGRDEKALAWKARELGFTLPLEWSRLIAPKRKKAPAAARPLLAYPYVATATDKHADLLAVNALVPRDLPENMRADICQEVLLAIYEGQTTIEALKARNGTSAYYIRKFYKDNYEQAGHALSFSAATDEGDERSYDEIASSIAAKDWHHDQLVERHRYVNGLPKLYTAPTQFEAAWQDQVGRTQIAMHDLGRFLSRDEVEELMECA